MARFMHFNYRAQQAAPSSQSHRGELLLQSKSQSQYSDSSWPGQITCSDSAVRTLKAEATGAGTGICTGTGIGAGSLIMYRIETSNSASYPFMFPRNMEPSLKMRAGTMDSSIPTGLRVIAPTAPENSPVPPMIFKVDGPWA